MHHPLSCCQDTEVTHPGSDSWLQLHLRIPGRPRLEKISRIIEVNLCPILSLSPAPSSVEQPFPCRNCSCCPLWMSPGTALVLLAAHLVVWQGWACCHGSALLRSPTFSPPQPMSHKCQQTSWVQKNPHHFIKPSIYKQQHVPEDKAFLSSDSVWHSWAVLSHSPAWSLQLRLSRIAASQSPFSLWRAESLPVAVPRSCCSRLLSPAVTLPALCQAQL